MGNNKIMTFQSEIKEFPAENEFQFMFVFAQQGANLSIVLSLKEIFTNPVIPLCQFCFSFILMVKQVSQNQLHVLEMHTLLKFYLNSQKQSPITMQTVSLLQLTISALGCPFSHIYPQNIQLQVIHALAKTAEQLHLPCSDHIQPCEEK